MIEQGTAEWFAERCGKVTASRIADMMAKTKTGYGAGRKNYLAQLTVERITGTVEDSFTSPAMRWGTETEPMAREAYQEATLTPVTEVGFIPHPNWPDDAGASPDGLVGDDGLVEIKCPNTATHIETLKTGVIADKYVKQMQWQMACTQRHWCDFVSFDPRMPEGLNIWIKRVERDKDAIVEIEQELEAFLADLQADVEALEAMKDA